jgi:hypothetical protein
MVVGSIGPVLVSTVPPLRKRFGDGPREKIPLTYPSKSLSETPQILNLIWRIVRIIEKEMITYDGWVLAIRTIS